MKTILFAVLGLSINIYSADSPKSAPSETILARNIILSNLFDTDTVKVLKKFKDLNTNEKVTKKQITLLMAASDQNKASTVAWLIEQKADIDVADTDGNTALHYAVWKDSETTIDVLRQNKASEKTNNSGNTPTSLALKLKSSKKTQKQDEQKAPTAEKN